MIETVAQARIPAQRRKAGIGLACRHAPIEHIAKHLRHRDHVHRLWHQPQVRDAIGNQTGHFGEQVDLSGLSDGVPGDAMRAHKRIMQTITDRLVPLRADEPDVPAFHDPTRPTDSRSPWRPA